MSAATAPFNAPELTRGYLNVPLAAAAVIYAGTMVALNAAGNAVPASDTAALRVIGRAEESVDNSAGAAADLSVTVKPGIFQYQNDATNAITKANVGKPAYVFDDNTVANTSTHKVVAGIVVRVDAEGVFINIGSGLPGAIAVVLTSTNGTAAGAADLAALKAEAEKIGDDVRAIYAALVLQGLLG
jgi:hypothetical protein